MSNELKNPPEESIEYYKHLEDAIVANEDSWERDAVHVLDQDVDYFQMIETPYVTEQCERLGLPDIQVYSFRQRSMTASNMAWYAWHTNCIFIDECFSANPELQKLVLQHELIHYHRYVYGGKGAQFHSKKGLLELTPCHNDDYWKELELYYPGHVKALTDDIVVDAFDSHYGIVRKYDVIENLLKDLQKPLDIGKILHESEKQIEGFLEDQKKLTFGEDLLD